MEDDPIATPSTIRLTLAGAACYLLLSGCAHLYDPIDEALTCVHCEKQALHTWNYVRGDYADVIYPHHFGAGFRAGYVNVCRGGSGCPPTLPPKCYWSIWYRNDTGRAKTVEWFNGYSAGATAAQGDGYQQFGQLVTASDAAGGCGCEQQEYDLSDLPSQQLPQAMDSPPGPSLIAPFEAIPETQPRSDAWPPTVPPSFAVPPAPPAWGHSTPSTPAFGHSIPTPTEPAPTTIPSLPAVPAESAPVEQTPPPYIPSSPDVEVFQSESGDEDSARLPFAQPLEQPETSAATDVTNEPKPSDDGFGLRSPESEPVDSALVPEPTPFLESEPVPHPPSQQVPPRNPDPWSRTPYSRGAPALVPPTTVPKSPDSDLPPLEDRFLPRPNQPTVVPPVPDHSASRQQPSRMLMDAFNRIEQASHQTRTVKP